MDAAIVTPSAVIVAVFALVVPFSVASAVLPTKSVNDVVAAKRRRRDVTTVGVPLKSQCCVNVAASTAGKKNAKRSAMQSEITAGCG